MVNKITQAIEQIQKDLDPVLVARLAYPVFYKNTPRRSGNARNNTKLNKNTIQADYPYAQRLDQGYSDQSPNGMTEPTAKWFENYVKKVSK
jgi:hypothetical protein